MNLKIAGKHRSRQSAEPPLNEFVRPFQTILVCFVVGNGISNRLEGDLADSEKICGLSARGTADSDKACERGSARRLGA